MARLEGLVEAEWIGQGKKYDMQNLPNSVSEAKAHYLLTIPNAFSDIIPNDIDNVPLSQSLLHLENGLGECATMVIGLGFGCWHIGVVGKVVPAKMGHCTR
ncbi:hypothetical protein JOM56_007945 [Amanita muscaria]